MRRLVDVSLHLMRTFGFDALASDARGRDAEPAQQQLPEAMVGDAELSLTSGRSPAA